MLTYYQSERLELRILKPDSSSAVLDFYERNRNTLEPVEPLRPQYFYTCLLYTSDAADEL